MPSPVKLTSFALGCVLVLGLSGCGGDDSEPRANTSRPPTSAPATAVVQGTLQLVGGPAPGKPQPLAGTVTFRGPDGSVTKAPVDKTGRFAIGLYPGTYTIEGTSPLFNDGQGRCFTDPPATKLTAGKTVTADVVCSIK